MRREDRDVIGERKHLVAERVVGRAGELILELGAEEIDARDLPDEESPTGEEVLGIVRPPPVGHEVGDVLRRVPRRRQAPHRELANHDDIAVALGGVRVLQNRGRAGMDGDRPKLGERP